jgi:predicted transcriptional regulator
MPKTIKFADARKKHPKAFHDANIEARKAGKWKDDLDDEKNLKDTYKQLSGEQKHIIDEIFRKYNLTVTLTGNRNFTIQEDNNNVVETVASSLQSFEKVEEPNTAKLLELETQINELKQKQDPLVKQNKDLQDRIKKLEDEKKKLRNERLEKFVANVMKVVSGVGKFAGKMAIKVAEKPLEYTIAGIAIYLFYKLYQLTTVMAEYLGKWFQTNVEEIAQQFNKTDPPVHEGPQLLQLPGPAGAVNTAVNTMSASAERMVEHTVEQITHTFTVITTIVATTALFGVLGVTMICFLMMRNRDPAVRHQGEAAMDIVNAQNEIIGRVATSYNNKLKKC